MCRQATHLAVRRRWTEDDLVRDPVVVNEVHAAAPLLLVAFPRELLEQFAAEFQRVAALGRVEEVGRGGRGLLAIAIELPALMRTFEHRAASVTPEVAEVAV